MQIDKPSIDDKSKLNRSLTLNTNDIKTLNCVASTATLTNSTVTTTATTTCNKNGTISGKHRKTLSLAMAFK